MPSYLSCIYVLLRRSSFNYQHKSYSGHQSCNFPVKIPSQGDIWLKKIEAEHLLHAGSASKYTTELLFFFTQRWQHWVIGTNQLVFSAFIIIQVFHKKSTGCHQLKYAIVIISCCYLKEQLYEIMFPVSWTVPLLFLQEFKHWNKQMWRFKES